MRIAFNLINMTSAGTFSVGFNLLKALTRRAEHEYFVLLPAGHGYEEIDFPAHMHARFYKKRFANSLWRLWFDFFGVPRWIRANSIDVYCALGNHAPARLKVPKMVLFHNPYYTDWKTFELTPLQRITKLFERCIFARTVRDVDIIIAQSEFMAERLRVVWKIASDRIRIIPNPVSEGIQINLHRGPNDTTTGAAGMFLYASRYYPHKNHEFLIPLAAKLHALGHDDIRFALTLDETKPGAAGILATIRERGLDRYFLNLGELTQEQLAGAYQESLALVFPSKAETFGNPLLEAMACGLPVLAADLPYARAVCGTAALYFDLNDTDAALEQILRLQQDTQLRNDLSQAGRERHASFPDNDQVADQYLEMAAELHRGGST